MKHFSIDSENNITVHSSKTAARETGAAVFSTEVQFADAIGADNKRLVEIWNSLPGVKPVAKFANRKVATERIWKAIQDLGEAPAPAPAAEPQSAVEAEPTVVEVPVAAPAPEPAAIEPLLESAAVGTSAEHTGADLVQQPAAAEPVATVGEKAPDVAPTPTEPKNEATPVKKARKAKQAAKPQESAGPREGSKTAQVVAMMQRKGGATITEIMKAMDWQKHTVRGFVAGSLKKAGYTVESFKPEGGERSYRINP